VLANLDVSIGGVTQLPSTDYTWTGGQTITFTAAPPNGAKILVRYLQALPQGVSDASLVSYSAAVSYSVGSIGNSLKTLEQTVNGLSVSSPATGVFFETSAGDTFTGQTQYPTNAALTVTPSKAAFSAATATVSDIKVKQPDGNPLTFCFDNWTIEATFTVTSFPAGDISGFLTGFLDYNPQQFGGEVKSFPGSATTLFSRLFLNNAIVANDGSGVAFTAGDKVVVQMVYSGNTLTYNFTYGAGSLRTLSTTMVLTATSYELPRLFVTPGVRMMQGVFALNSLKIYAKYPGAKFAFVGDSITQGRFATNFADGFPQLMRTQFPNGVIVCGAPAAKVSDWISPAYSVTAMRPKYAFVMLGTNDVSTSVPLATTQANYINLLGKFVAAGIVPIIMTIPPNGNSNTPAFNTWLKSLGYQYIDIYATLYGSGNSMNATYDSGDGIHPNTAGNLAIYNAIMTFIQANGL
jgi:lysophospholipase L1-like esterase